MDRKNLASLSEYQESTLEEAGKYTRTNRSELEFEKLSRTSFQDCARQIGAAGHSIPNQPIALVGGAL